MKRFYYFLLICYTVSVDGANNPRSCLELFKLYDDNDEIKRELDWYFMQVKENPYTLNHPYILRGVPEFVESIEGATEDEVENYVDFMCKASSFNGNVITIFEDYQLPTAILQQRRLFPRRLLLVAANSQENSYEAIMWVYRHTSRRLDVDIESDLELLLTAFSNTQIWPRGTNERYVLPVLQNVFNRCLLLDFETFGSQRQRQRVLVERSRELVARLKTEQIQEKVVTLANSLSEHKLHFSEDIMQKIFGQAKENNNADWKRIMNKNDFRLKHCPKYNSGFGVARKWVNANPLSTVFLATVSCVLLVVLAKSLGG